MKKKIGGVKRKMENEVWSKKGYYDILHKANLESVHPADVLLKKISKKALSILDLGCGEGSRLDLLRDGSEKRAVGVDISETAIRMAKKNYPGIKFIRADLEKLPLKDNSFDLVYSAYVLEHLSNPEKVIGEAIRVTGIGSTIFFVSPNYGAPNRASPPFSQSRMKKFIYGLISDFYFRSKYLNWGRVEPIANKREYVPDWDTVVEPYIGTLIKFLQSRGMEIVLANSFWKEELPNAKFHQRIFRFLGEKGVSPFGKWGPHMVVVAKKYE